MIFPVARSSGGKPSRKLIRESLVKLLLAPADQPIKVQKKGTVANLIAERLVKKAIKSTDPLPYIKEIADRVDGKPDFARINDSNQQQVTIVMPKISIEQGELIEHDSIQIEDKSEE